MRAVSFRLVVAFAAIAAGAAPVAASPPADAQLQVASVSAIVVDAGGSPVAAVRVSLTDPLGAELQHALTDAEGRVVFAGVAPGRYALRTSAPGAPVFDLPVTLNAALPLEVLVRIPGVLTDRVTVEGAHIGDRPSGGSIAGDSLARVPARVRSRAVQDVVATLPGWSTENNGLLHLRGIDDGFLYVIDGVPVYERLDAMSGLAPDLTAVAAVNVLSGYVPPEFGYKAGGVVEIRSVAAPPSWMAMVELARGSDALLEGSTAAGGPVGQSARVRAGVSGVGSDRYLDAVHPDNLHNRGAQASTFGQLEWSVPAGSHLMAGWGYGGAAFDVPHGEAQEEAGQDQRQRIGQGFAHLTWQRVWSSDAVTHVAAYHRHTRARLDPSLTDRPLRAAADRRLLRTGVAAGMTRQARAHLLKGGLEWQRLSMAERFEFFVTDAAVARQARLRDEVLEFTSLRPFSFADEAGPALWSFYLQDSWQPTSGVTVNGGLRFDRTGLLLPRRQSSPRAGIVVRTGDDTTLRASVGRLFQPPQPEYLLLSSSPEARVLGAHGDQSGGAEVEPERQWALEAGIEHRLGRRLRIDAAYWRRRIVNVADPNVFAGTTIVFPNAVAKGRAHGLELRLELPQHRGWSAYGNWALGRVVQTGPITGGLFLEDDVEEIGPGVEFVPDHDQRVTAGAGITWEHGRSGVTLSLAGRYETGTPVQQDEEDLEELGERPGAELVDFEAARVKARAVWSIVATAPLLRTARVSLSTSVEVSNLFDRRYAYSFGNPFSGTHFGAPRSVAVNVRLAFE